LRETPRVRNRVANDVPDSRHAGGRERAAGERRVRPAIWRLVAPAAWAPLVVFVVHVILDRGLGAYDAQPWLDLPMHVCGGMAVAYVIRTALRRLADPAGEADPSISGDLLIVTGTATVAILWEFAEFGVDRMLGTTLQGGLPDTMKDLAMGLLGAVALAIGGAIRDAGRTRPR
jgi:hypothetical protein